MEKLSIVIEALKKDLSGKIELNNTCRAIKEFQIEIQKEKPPFKIVEHSKGNKVEQNITGQDLKNLKYDESITELERIINIHINGIKSGGRVNGIFNVGKDTVNINIVLTPKLKKDFLKKYHQKDILCKATITYNETLDIFSMYHLEIYSIFFPLEKWIEFMKNKSLKERIEDTIKIFGLNPDTMLYHEKIIFIFRIIPLVVKKFLMVELSKKELGKTEIYSSLGFLPYTLLVTRAGMFFDGRTGKSGDFFSEDIAFIIDELTKINDSEVITALQVYMNGNKYKGKIQINSKETRETEISPILLGNIKQENFNFLSLFSDGKNIFKDTIVDSMDGEAFISRINAIPNSWGCRTFSSDMKLETRIDFYDLEVLKAVILLLREEELDISKIYESIGIQWKSPSIRAQESVEKSFEGLIKLLFPEFINGIMPFQLQQFKSELLFLYERAVEMRKVVDNQLKIINSNNNKEDNFPFLKAYLKNVVFNITEPHLFTPHRIFIDCKDGYIKKIPLDTIGIEQNKIEMILMEEYDEAKRYDKDFNFDLKSGVLIHNEDYCKDNIKITLLNKSDRNHYIRSHRSYYEYKDEISNQDDRYYNFLTGEEEVIKDNELIDFIFFDLEKYIK